ncbi:MAG: winged helix-turn-helix domain-containing protein, partial [Antricoccus sp.]
MMIAQSVDGHSASEIAGQHGLSQPTAHHLLATPADEGLIAKDPRRRYVLSPSASIIANAVFSRTSPRPLPGINPKGC